MKSKNCQQTVVALGNMNELVYNIVERIMGNEIADTFEGSDLTRGTIYNIAQAQAQAQVAPYLGGSNA
jgi:hypothetical protein